MALLLPTLHAAMHYMATNGDDTNAGTLEKPFATIQRAQQAAAPGDPVPIRGGTYVMEETQIARKQRIWAYVTLLDKNGTPDQRICYWACPAERPVFDFSLVKPAGLRIHAFHVPASWIHNKGLEVTGVQVTAKRHTQSICFANEGSHNIYGLLSLHDVQTSRPNMLKFAAFRRGVVQPAAAAGVMVGIEAAGFIANRQAEPYRVAWNRIRQLVFRS